MPEPKLLSEHVLAAIPSLINQPDQWAKLLETLHRNASAVACAVQELLGDQFLVDHNWTRGIDASTPDFILRLSWPSQHAELSVSIHWRQLDESGYNNLHRIAYRVGQGAMGRFHAHVRGRGPHARIMRSMGIYDDPYRGRPEDVIRFKPFPDI